ELLLLHEGQIVESGQMVRIREKYQTKNIELTFMENAEAIHQQLKERAFVKTSTVVGNTIDVRTDDVEQGRKVIMKLAVEAYWPLTDLRTKVASLEDMFMTAVK